MASHCGNYDGTTNTVYIDGVFVDSNVQGGAIPTNAEDLRIGTKPGAGAVGDYFDGLIDEVRVYNRVLGATEVAALAKSGAVKFTTSSVELQRGSTLANGLVGLWTFDGPDTQSTITDRSGSNNHGYFNGGATSSAKTIGKLGQALNFDGSGARVAVTLNSGLPLYPTNTAYSVSAWVKGAQQAGGVILTEDNSGDTGEFSIVSDTSGSTGRMEIIIIDDLGNLDEDVHSNGTVFDNTWHHFVWTDNNGTAATYIDGVLDRNDISYARGGGYALDSTTIGAAISGSFAFNGKIDDVRTYNRVLTAAEVKQLYKLGTVIIRP